MTFIRRLPKFEHHAPISIPEALLLLDRYGERAALLAGGTDLLVAMKKREKVPEHLINLKGIEELKGIHVDGKEEIRIGALTTLAELERSQVVKEKLVALWEAVHLMASPQIRTIATIGGNLCNAMPSADTAAPLIALGAWVTIVGPEGERKVWVENFFKGPGVSDLRGNEILTEVFIPHRREPMGSVYLKLMRRNVMDLAQVGVAVCLTFESNKRICKEGKIALGAVAQTPIRAPQAEATLAMREIDPGVAKKAGRIASEEASPRSSLRASKEYRKAMVGVLTERAILEASRRIQ